jgi:hypothetical protein
VESIITDEFEDFAPLAPLLSNDTSDESSWRIIRQWHNDCKENHATCNNEPSPTTWLSPIDKTWLPTRLVDVGEDHGRDMRIISTANLKDSSDIPISYLALSHCWGKPKIKLLNNKQNEREFQTGVPIAELARISKMQYVQLDDWDSDTSGSTVCAFCRAKMGISGMRRH